MLCANFLLINISLSQKQKKKKPFKEIHTVT